MSTASARPPGTLYVVGTPIGNLGDLSPRARRILTEVEIIAAEDTRRARRLLSDDVPQAQLIAYHDHNEREVAGQLVERLSRGANIALVTDAGTPLVSDPGWQLVGLAIANGIDVVSVPGPSALTAALSISGLPTDRFVFEGFLPRREKSRQSRLEEFRGEPRTMVFYESVHRLQATLRDMARLLGEQRPAVLARELTKLHEATYFGTLAAIRDRLGRDIPLLGEFVLVVAGDRSTAAPVEDEVRRVYALLQDELPPGKAAALTAMITGMRRNDVYRLVKAASD